MTPSFSVRLLTPDPVSVLQRGALVIELTARHAASVRLVAVAGGPGRPIAVAAPKTFRVRARQRKRRVLRLVINALGRRALSTCYATDVTLIVRARSYGSPPLKTRRPTKLREQRFHLRCHNGQLLIASGSSPGVGPGGASGGSGSGALPYQVGLDAQPIDPCPNGTWGGAPDRCGTGTVFLGGFGFAGGPVGVGPATTPSPAKGRPASGPLLSTDTTLKNADGAHTRAIAIAAGRQSFLLGDIEVQGWFVANKTPGTGIIDMRKQVARDLGGSVDAQHVFIQSVHSHSGADAMGVWGGVPTSFLAYMAHQTVTALERAYVDRQPGQLYYGSADGIDLLANQFAADPVNASLDSDLRVLQARDAHGQPFATLLDFSAHSTMLGPSNLKLSGDWAQAANALMEKRFGGQAMTVVGTLGRTQPNRDAAQAACPDPRHLGDGDGAVAFCRIEKYGSEVVDRAAQALSHATPLAGPPRVDAHSYLITDPATNGVILAGEAIGGPLGFPFNRSIAPPWLSGNVLGTVTGTARIGDVLLSSVPGEIYPQIALKVRDTVTGIRHGGHQQDGFMTAGLSNDQLGYIIAPLEAYPQPIERSLFTQPLSADVIQGCVQSPNPPTFGNCPQPSPLSNDNYFFNVSHTLGERVTCSLLRGADEVLHPAQTSFRDSYSRCGLFANDSALPAGSDVLLGSQTSGLPSVGG